jgi:type I restriction enzyme S subunit
MINEAWNWRPLGELFEIGAGKTMSAAARDGAFKTPFLRTSNVLWDEIDLTVVDEMAIPEQELATKLLRPGDLLVCEGGEIGRAAIWNGEREVMSFQNHLHRLRPLNGEVEPRFYVYFLQAAFTQLGIFEGAGNKTTIPNLSRNRLAALEVPHPPLTEQQDIATALARVREAIKTHDRSTAAAQELKRAAMRTLFTRGLRGEAQKETEIGPVPESWKRLPISALGEVVTGNTPPTKNSANYVGGDIPFIAPGDFEHGSRIKKTEKLITDEGLKRSRPISAGTTCFVCIGSTIGKVGYATAPICATNQQINSILPRDDFDPPFVFYLLTFWSDHVRKQASPSPVPILSKGAFEQIGLFASTDIDEQRQIASILDAIDRKIDLHKRKRAVLDELFKALLHKLMTGEIRVADLDLSALAPAALPTPEAAA